MDPTAEGMEVYAAVARPMVLQLPSRCLISHSLSPSRVSLVGEGSKMLLRPSQVLLRRGKPRPRAGMFPDKYRRVPALLKPQQGGQQYFSEFLIKAANDALVEQQRHQTTEDATHGTVYPLLPQMDVEEAMARTTEERVREEMKTLVANDAFTSVRGFNELAWYEEERARMQGQGHHHHPSPSDTAAVPERVLGEEYFNTRYGYSLLKESTQKHSDGSGSGDAASPTSNYDHLDLWGEMPKYQRDMIFLYLISRRRNTYAVAYDYDGKRLLNTYTAGNRGLKGGDRGFRGDGSTDNGHQVTSMYLNDLLPRIREHRAAAGRPLAKGEKVNLVVRVMGFYNGRQGAVRAVQDRSAEFTVRYVEDITPFPRNGPKMPRGVFS